MSARKLSFSEDVSPARWIKPRLSGAFGSVTSTVPDGFPAYARVFHPAATEEGEWRTWTEVAEVTGGRPHPRMQWHALVGSRDPYNFKGSRWSGDHPDTGNLPPHALAELCEVLARHTRTAEKCWFCLWEGYGWIHGGAAITVLYASTSDDESDPAADASSDPGTELESSDLDEVAAPSRLPETDRYPSPSEAVPSAFGPTVLDGPRVALPDRDYLLFSGPLRAALEMGWRPESDQFHPEGWFEPQSPNLFWPADRAWCVATEIDFNSTLVAGSQALVDALVRTPGLEVFPAEPTDPLSFDGDTVNPVH